jgi:UDP-N-acetylmuramoyl-tripeptide--D-alanyl-D-alanine ligase
MTIVAPGFTKDVIALRMRVPGRHAAWMAAAALTVGFSFGCDLDAMRKVIASFTAEHGRLQTCTVGTVRIIDDSYNANPDSVIAALETLAAMHAEGQRIAVLGDMLELGASSREEHRAVGEALQRLPIPFVFTYGSHARMIGAAAAARGRATQHFSDKATLQRALAALVAPGDTVLVKGSRGMHMEEVVTALVYTLHAQEGE